MALDQIRDMFFPLPVTFTEDGQIDEPLVRDFVDYYVERGVNALFALGSFGQGPAMDVAERKQALEIIVDQTRGRVPVVAHVGTADTFSTIELGRHARSLGVEAVGLVGPYYYKERPLADVIEHFRAVEREVGLPIFFYNNPRYSGYAVNPDQLARLVREVPSVFGTKLAFAGIDQGVQFAAALPAGFGIFAIASVLFPGMYAGITGTCSPTLSLHPELGVRLIQLIKAGEVREALDIQVKIAKYEGVVLKLLEQYGLSVFREGLRLRGFPIRLYPRWPTQPFPESARDELARAIEATGCPVYATT
jgi:dihydrodipicolinate synthase/N-acetylneuraminate lyase